MSEHIQTRSSPPAGRKTLRWSALLAVVTGGLGVFGFFGLGQNTLDFIGEGTGRDTNLSTFFTFLGLPLLVPLIILVLLKFPPWFAWIPAALVHFLFCLFAVKVIGPLVQRTWRMFRDGGRARRRTLWVLLALVAAVWLLINLLEYRGRSSGQ